MTSSEWDAWITGHYSELVAPVGIKLYGHDAEDIVQTVLATLTTSIRRKEFSFYLGSLSGDELYRNISENSDLKRKYAQAMIEWYEKYSQKDWYVPKFLSHVEKDFPDLKPRIEMILKKI